MIDLCKHAIALHFLNPGDAVIDAGAFIGSYSFFYRKIVGSKGLVFAYEPQPPAIGILKSRLKGVQNILVREKAASSSDGEKIAMKIYLGRLDQGCTVEPLLMSPERMPGSTTVVEVETERLDSVLPLLAGRPLSLIKIDTEGHESNVIRGAMELIRLHQPLIVMEYGFIPGKFEPTTIGQLEGQGYTCFDLKTMESASPGYISLLPTDIVAVPACKLDAFRRFAKALPKSPFLLKARLVKKLSFCVLRGWFG